MTEKKMFELGGLSVAIAIPAYRGTVPIDLNNKIMGTCSKLQKMGVSHYLITERECAIVSTARNRLVDRFLETGANRLFFIDDDIVFEVDKFIRLLCWSTMFPIVCGAYPMRQYPIKFNIDYNQNNPEINEYGLLKIRSTGIGFTIIDRSVFEQMNVLTFLDQGKEIKEYFTMETKDGKFYGEDVSFMRNCGQEIWLDPLASVGHFGNHIFEGNFSDILSEQLLEG